MFFAKKSSVKISGDVFLRNWNKTDKDSSPRMSARLYFPCQDVPGKIQENNGQLPELQEPGPQQHVSET